MEKRIFVDLKVSSGRVVHIARAAIVELDVDPAHPQLTLLTLSTGQKRIALESRESLLERLEGGCQVPLGALGLPYEGGLRLWGLVASPDGRRAVRADLTGDPRDPEALGVAVAEALLERGAGDILDEVRGEPPAVTAP